MNHSIRLGRAGRVHESQTWCTASILEIQTLVLLTITNSKNFILTQSYRYQLSKTFSRTQISMKVEVSWLQVLSKSRREHERERTGTELWNISHKSALHAFKMAAKQVAQSAGKTVFKPLLSTSHAEARRRVLNLYRAWWREVLTYHLIWSYGLIYSIKALNVMR